MSAAPHRTALITGASSGLGRALSLWFARRETRVFAAARREDSLAALRDEAAGAGGTIEPIRMDVSDGAATAARIQRLDDECGGLDLVIANAGIGDEMSARKISWERVAPILQTNVLGAAATLVAILPRMVERDRGQLVGVSSIASFRGMPRLAAYSASKAFLSNFLEGLRVELAKTNVRVTCIQPGYVKSELTAKNKAPMPFLLETEDAADRMGRAIVRGAGEFTFPVPMAVAMRALQLTPNALFDLALAPRKRSSSKSTSRPTED